MTTAWEQLKECITGEHDPWEYVFVPIKQAEELVAEMELLRESKDKEARR